MDSLTSVLHHYGIADEGIQLEPMTGGLINKTWKVAHGQQQFVLQCINSRVFDNPYDVADNVRMIDQYLKANSPSYLFISQIKSKENEEVVQDDQGAYFRLFPFVNGSHTLHNVPSPEHAFEASFQFGRFAKLLSNFNISRLNITIPDFHNLPLRYRQLGEILLQGNKERIKQAGLLISKIQCHQEIVDLFSQISKSQQVVQRVTHHDTKISNVLFDAKGKGICVIDLDTVMPGYFISDVGDMMRTYLSPVNEEEGDFDRIEIREDYFKAIVQGYLSNMGNELTNLERGLLFYSGRFMIFMQCVRFLTDYCNNDLYYGATYPEQNFIRAANQMNLLEKLEGKERLLQEIITSELKVKSHFPMG